MVKALELRLFRIKPLMCHYVLHRNILVASASFGGNGVVDCCDNSIQGYYESCGAVSNKFITLHICGIPNLYAVAYLFP